MQSDLRINFYGFVGNKQFNDANDMGYLIDTTEDLLDGYDVDGKGRIYRIDALKGKEVIGNIFIAIKEPKVQYLIVKHENGIIHAVTPGSVVDCSKTDRLNILSIISNVTVEPFVNIFIAKGKNQWQELLIPAVLEIPLNANLHFRRQSLNLGSISFRITE